MQKFFGLVVIVFGMMLRNYTSCVAQTTIADYYKSMTLEELLQIKIVSSSKFEQDQSKAPNVNTLINKEVINSFNWHSINDILYKQSGFFPSQDYERSTMGARGVPESWNSNHLLLMIDGIPFNDKLHGGAIISDALPLVFTKTIEIIEGPGSALYGSNAINGTVTSNTISASDFDGNKVFTNIQIGQHNNIFCDVLATVKTNNFDITSSLSYNSTDDEKYLSYDGSHEIDSQTNSLRKLEPNFGKRNGYFFLKVEGNKSLDGWSLQYHSQLTNVETGFGWLWNIPDKDEMVKDWYNSLVLKYNNDFSDRLIGEWAVKYTHHNMYRDVWYFREGALDGWYPEGVNEFLKSSNDDIFMRFQLLAKTARNSRLVVAVEPDIFMYSGDKEHYSNADLLNKEEHSPPLYENRDLGPYLEMLENKSVNNVGSSVQFSTGDLLGKVVGITAGVRYDIQFFKYDDVYLPDKPQKSKTFSEFSPRLSVVISPSEKLTLKLIGLTAFRAPSPAELLCYNTWLAAPNINQLKSERIRSAEMAMEYKLNKYTDLRTNVFYTVSEGQIGYSLSNNNLSTNLYDLTNAGIESEVLFIKNNFSAFANITYVQRLDEKIYENEQEYVSLHRNKLTWAPAFTANFGCVQHMKKIKISAQGHLQGKVLRREKDLFSSEELQELALSEEPRPQDVKPWATFDIKMAYKHKAVELGLIGTNVFNTKGYLIKTMKFPFDYKIPSRVMSLALNIEI